MFYGIINLTRRGYLMKKNYVEFHFLLLVLALTASIVFGCSSAMASSKTSKGDEPGLNQAKVINVGWQGSTDFRHIGVAEGFFEKEFGPDGITVNFLQFSFGPPIIEALAAGSLDFGHVGDMPVVTAIANGIPIQSIIKTGIDPNSNTLLVSLKSTVSSPSELKGKVLGTSVGSSAHHYLVLLLAKEGLSVDDVEIVNLSATDLEAALASGEIEAGTTWEPYGTIITGKGSAKIIAKSAGVKQNTSTIIARNEFAAQNPELTARFLKVLLQIHEFIQEDRGRAIKIVADQSGFSESDLATLQVTEYIPYFTDYDWDQMKKTKQFLLDSGLIEKDFDITGLYNDQYLIEADKLYKKSK